MEEIEEMSSEEKDEFIIGYEESLRRMEDANTRMFSLIKIFIEEKNKRSLSSRESEQIRENFSKYDISVKDIYDIVILM